MNEGLNKLAHAIDGAGEVVMEVFGPPNALSSADTLSEALYVLSETLIRGVMPDSRGGGLGGEFGYGCDYENDVFMMHHYCWCEKEECQWCSRKAANFLHKKSGWSVTWYKWIGRDMKFSEVLSGEKTGEILRECWESIPPDARERASIEHDYENTPEFKAAQAQQMAALFAAMRRVDDAMRPCFKCSMSPEPGWVGGKTEWDGEGGKICTVVLDKNGACTNCGHITSPKEAAILEERLAKMHAAMRIMFSKPKA